MKRLSDKLLVTGLVCGMVVSVLLPRIQVIGLSVGLDDLLGALGFAYGACWFIANWAMVRTAVLRWLIFIWLLLFTHGILSSLVAVYDVLGHWTLPTEYWQYIKRCGFFAVMVVVVARQKIEVRTLMGWLCSTFIVALGFGLLQGAGVSAADSLATLYARTDSLLDLAIREQGIRRVFGVAGHPNAWSGFAACAFAFSLGGLLINDARDGARARSYLSLGALRASLILIAFAAAANVFLSASRVGLLCLLMVILAAIVGLAITGAGSTRKYSTLLLLLFSPAVIAMSLFESRTLFLLYRLSVLMDTGGGARIDQIEQGMALVDGPDTLLLGVGNATQRALAVGHGIEVEPIYLLVNYGLIGVGIRVLLLGLILYAGWRLACLRRGDLARLGFATALCVVSSVGLMSGYFFFQEIVVGTTVWIIFGATVGAYEQHFGCLSQKRGAIARIWDKRNRTQ